MVLLYQLVSSADDNLTKEEFNKVEWFVDHTPRVSCFSFSLIEKAFCVQMCNLVNEFFYLFNTALQHPTTTLILLFSDR